MNVLKKKINYGKRFIILMLLVNFVVLSFCYSYALFVTKQLQENVAVLVTKGGFINITSNSLVDNSILVKANERKDIIIDLTNKTSNDLNYLLLHEKVPTGVMIYETNSDNTSIGLIKRNETLSTNITIENNTPSEVRVEFYCQVNDEMIVDKDMGYSFINNSPNYDHSGANSPDLTNVDGIPVYYDRAEEVWKKADNLNIDKDNIWYDYDNGRWANMVLVNEYNRYNYLYADNGTVIDEGDILGYFVWIPSFRYSIINSNNPTSYEKDVNVIFENGLGKQGTVICTDNLNSSSDRHIYSEICKDDVNGKIYDNLSTYSHPAFDSNSTGFWISKFQVSSTGTKVVPNAPSFKTTLDKAIEISNSYQEEDNMYGILGTNLNTHMLSNMEWGAVSILSSSLYGKSGNKMYFTENNHSFKRVYVNTNNSSYYTGCSSNYSINSKSFITSSTSSCIRYNDLSNYTHTSNGVVYPIGEVGPGASTTGTIYGVYDMAGATREMVGGIVMDEDNTLKDKYNNDYFDLYSSNTYTGTINDASNVTEIYRYKLGDGIKEHYRTFNDNGLWFSGSLKQSSKGGIITRGGDSNSGKAASIYSSDVIPIEESSAFRVAISMKEEL